MGAWLAPLPIADKYQRSWRGLTAPCCALMGVRDTAMDWREYARAVLLFSLLGANCCMCCNACRAGCRSTPANAAR